MTKILTPLFGSAFTVSQLHLRFTKAVLYRQPTLQRTASTLSVDNYVHNLIVRRL